ncbi:MAG: hypothetical protein PHC95_15970 [Parabacteroides sp.]|nr:hypothetical protein [Parabacteroides sp.]
MTILQLIIAACIAKGVPEKYAERIQKTFKIEKAEGLETFVDLFKDNILPAITEAEQAAQTAAQAAAVAEYEKTHGLKDGKPVQTPPDLNTPPAVDLTKLSPELQALFTTQQKQLGDLTTLVTGMVTSQQRNQKLDLVRSKLKGKIDDDFLEDYATRVNLDAENLDTEVDAKVKEFGIMKQKFIGKAVADGNYIPASGGVSDTEFDGFLGATKDETPAFKGREL